MKKLILYFIIYYISSLFLYIVFNDINNIYDRYNVLLTLFIGLIIYVSYKLNKRNNLKVQDISIIAVVSGFSFMILFVLGVFYKIFPFYKTYSFNGNKFYFIQTAEILGYSKPINNIFNLLFYFIIETLVISIFYFIITIIIDKIYNISTNKPSIFLNTNNSKNDK